MGRVRITDGMTDAELLALLDDLAGSAQVLSIRQNQCALVALGILPKQARS
jgi:hypothetical protein